MYERRPPHYSWQVLEVYLVCAELVLVYTDLL